MSRFFETSHAHDGNDAHKIEHANLTNAPTNYALLTTMSAGVTAAGNVVFGAGTGAVVDGAWVTIPEAVTIEEVADANTKYPYLSASGPYLSATAPTYDATLGYWTDGAGGRWLGCVFPKSAASTFYAGTATGQGANVAHRNVGQTIRTGTAFVGGTYYEVTGFAAWAVSGAVIRAEVLQGRTWNANGSGRIRNSTINSADNLNIWGATVASGNVSTQSVLLYCRGVATYFTVTDIAATSASFDYLYGVAHQF